METKKSQTKANPAGQGPVSDGQEQPREFKSNTDSETLTSIRNPEGQWRKGTSGNPAGRPAGSRNHATLLLQALLDGEGEKIARKAIEQAKQGDPHALRLCLERLVPARRERLIDLPMPEVKTAQDARVALSSVLVAVGDSQITPGEGEILTRILEAHKRVIETEDHDRRIAELERAVKSQKGGWR